MDIREIFENTLKIEPKVVSIESLFNNPERIKNTNYKPYYQRNYVWDDEKATYFIESILLGTEIPPLIYFRSSDKVEVLDGRQRYETILRFIRNEFKLKKNGLQRLDNIGIANKLFKDIGIHLQDIFWDTKLRLIEFSFHSPKLVDEESEESVKREIFKRYNSGITPLKPAEIDKAFYFEDDLNSYLKAKLQGDQILHRNIANILHFEKSNDEVLLKKIRQLLVQHRIPIKYYAVKKDTIISKYYEYLFSSIDDSQVEEIYRSLIEKVNLISKIKTSFANQANYNRLITECLFWAFSILETEEISLKEVTDGFLDELVAYLNLNLSAFAMVNHSFSKELFTRYDVTSQFFAKKFNVDFSIYLWTSADFKKENQELSLSNHDFISFDELRINKPEPSSIAIMDITRLMERQRFLIRPPYQRTEVINKKKSSSIIESILLGIKLPPIFVYKRKDDISEVLDGQQRLLSILAFMQKPYLDESNQLKHSNKDGFTLNLKNSILSNLHGKKFDQLNAEQKEKIKNFDLWIIEISHRNNNNFEPIDLFIRLNNKPYPIKEDTFELWNSYISRDIIDTIKTVHKSHKDWFYIRKNNSRMDNENFYTTLAYFQLCRSHFSNDNASGSKELDIYRVGKKINFRVKSKNEITKVLESPESKDDFIEAINELEFDFIRKLKILLSTGQDDSAILLNKNLDEIFRVENGKRTQQAFWELWYFLFDIPISKILANQASIRNGLRMLFASLNDTESRQSFDNEVVSFKQKYGEKKPNELLDTGLFAKLDEIATIVSGGIMLNLSKGTGIHQRNTIPYLRKAEFINFRISTDSIVDLVDNERSGKPLFVARPKLLVKKSNISDERLSTAYTDEKLAFGNDFVGLTVDRAGILPKFVLAVISSSLVYKAFLRPQQSHGEEPKPITLNELSSLPIPIVPVKKQQIFALVLDYILAVPTITSSTLFFERVLDGMVAELFHPVLFKERGISIISIINKLQPINQLNGVDREEAIRDAYEKFSDPSHALATDLLRFLAADKTTMVETPI